MWQLQILVINYVFFMKRDVYHSLHTRSLPEPVTVNEHNMAFSTSFVWNISHSNKNSAGYHPCAQVFILVGFLPKLNFLDRFSKNTQYEISRNTVQLEPRCSMRTDRHDEAFWNFVNAPKNAGDWRPEAAFAYSTIQWDRQSDGRRFK